MVCGSVVGEVVEVVGSGLNSRSVRGAGVQVWIRVQGRSAEAQ